MKQILLRSGLSPLSDPNVHSIMDRNLIGSNVGNLVYAYSLYRWLMTGEDVTIHTDHYRAERGKYTDEEIDRINEEYSMYVIPLADVFRPAWEPYFEHMTQFIRKLRIPVLLVGCGVCAPFEARVSDPFEKPSEKIVKDFLGAVLDHSAKIGTRGTFTAEYLESLGFGSEHVMAIGCPSVYTYGPELSVSEPDLSGASRIIVTNNAYAPDETISFLRRVMETHSNYLFIPQRVEELRAMYSGKDPTAARLAETHEDYPRKKHDPILTGGKTCFPLNIATWNSLVSGAGLSVGPRLHGGVICMLNKVPTLVLVKDKRTREVAEYHHFAWVPCSEIHPDSSLEQMVADADFKALSLHQRANFERYRSFLEQNKVDHIYKDTDTVAEALLDRKIREKTYQGPVYPIYSLGMVPRAKRFADLASHRIRRKL